MNSYKLKELDFVKCPTPEIAYKVAKIIGEQGGITNLHCHWSVYKENTCLSLSGYCNLKFYEKEKYNEITLEQLTQSLNYNYYELI